MTLADREHVEVEAAAAFRSWLGRNPASPGVWVVFAKRASGLPAPTYDDLVREALCFGWVDSVPGKVDEHRTKLYFSPRKPGSGWAATNKRRVEELEAQGRMRAAGRRAVERAKADGSWSRIDGSEAFEVPTDLRSAFRRQRGAKANFEAFPPGVRKQILQWIEQARTPATRERRIEETARLAAENRRANQRPAVARQ